MLSSLSQEGVYEKLQASTDSEEQRQLVAELCRRRQVAAAVIADVAWMESLLARSKPRQDEPNPPSQAEFTAWCHEQLVGIFDNWLMIRDYSDKLFLENARILVNELDARRKHCGFEAIRDTQFFRWVGEAVREFTQQLKTIIADRMQFVEETLRMSDDETKTRARRELDGTSALGTIAHALQHLDKLDVERQKWDRFRAENEVEYFSQVLMQFTGRLPGEAANLLNVDIELVHQSDSSRGSVGL